MMVEHEPIEDTVPPRTKKLEFVFQRGRIDDVGDDCPQRGSRTVAFSYTMGLRSCISNINAYCKNVQELVEKTG